MAMIPSVNRIFLRRSGVARAERNALSTRDLLGGTGITVSSVVVAGDGTGRGTRAGEQASYTSRTRGVPQTLTGQRPPKSGWARLGPAATMTAGPSDVRLSPRAGTATRRADLLGRTRGKRVGGKVQLHAGHIPIAKHLDQLALADKAVGRQLLNADRATIWEDPRDVADIHRLVLGTEPVAETTQLWQPHVNGHLATLEPRGHVLAGLGALCAASGGLALGTLTTADPGLRRF